MSLLKYFTNLINQKSMSVKYKMVPKKNSLVTPPTVKYYPCAVSQGEVNLDDLAKIIASRSTVSTADCYGVIYGLTQVIGEMLSEGKIVKIQSLGSLKVTLHGTPADTEEELGKSNIKKVNVIYKPAKELKKTLNQISFKRIRP